MNKRSKFLQLPFAISLMKLITVVTLLKIVMHDEILRNIFNNSESLTKGRILTGNMESKTTVIFLWFNIAVSSDSHLFQSFRYHVFFDVQLILIISTSVQLKIRHIKIQFGYKTKCYISSITNVSNLYVMNHIHRP